MSEQQEKSKIPTKAIFGFFAGILILIGLTTGSLHLDSIGFFGFNFKPDTSTPTPSEVSPDNSGVSDINQYQSCPTNNEVREVDLPGNPQSYDQLRGSFGSSTCVTFYVDGPRAYWFVGIDNILYTPAQTRLFIAPNNWTEIDIRAFLGNQGILFDSIERKP